MASAMHPAASQQPTSACALPLLLLPLLQVGSAFSTWAEAYGISNATFLSAVSKRHEVDTEGGRGCGCVHMQCIIQDRN